MTGQNPPERQVGDILHRGQREHRFVPGQQRAERRRTFLGRGPEGTLDGGGKRFHGGQSSALESRLRRSWTALFTSLPSYNMAWTSEVMGAST